MFWKDSNKFNEIHLNPVIKNTNQIAFYPKGHSTNHRYTDTALQIKNPNQTKYSSVHHSILPALFNIL